MAVRFILGRSGTGKTSHCIESISRALAGSDPAESLILLVPAQATYQAERAILGDGKIAGYSNLHILSFERLVFLLSGKSVAVPEISRIGQEMIIHKILRTNCDKLKIFSAAALTPGLAAKVAHTIIELHHCVKTPQDVSELAENLKQTDPNSITTVKFADIAAIYQQYLEFIDGKFVNPDIQLTIARKNIAHADFIKGARLWVDGFAGFGVQQRDLLAEMLKLVKESHIALCLDPALSDLKNLESANIETTALFSATHRTYIELTEIIKNCKLKTAEPIILDTPQRFRHSPVLAHIEKNLFCPDPDSPIEAKDDIQIIAAANIRAEVNYIACEILRLVKQQNYRFRDIAVIVSDMTGYQHYIEAGFGDYNIPFFIDRRKSLKAHPAVELIDSALQAAINGFASKDVLACLKTDLMGMGRYEVDMLENYCLAFNINGRDWLSEQAWSFAGKDDKQFDQQRIDKIRRKAIEPLTKLKQCLWVNENSSDITSEQFCLAVFEFLSELQLAKQLQYWSTDSAEDRHLQLYEKLIGIFDELTEIFAAQPMNPADYASILSEALSKLTLACIPPTLDQVLIGSIERSRHPNLKAVFLAGVSQKQFPVPLSFEQLLSDEDRTAAEAQNFTLDGNLHQQLSDRQYLAYIAFTRPAHRLYITYPLTDASGGAIECSQFLSNLKLLFTDLTQVRSSNIEENIEDIHTPARLADMLCEKLGKDNPTSHSQTATLVAMLQKLGNDPDLTRTAMLVNRGLDYKNTASLDAQITDKLFTGPFNCSASRLSSFAACPYQYFAKHILKLKKRKLFGLEPMDLGAFYHHVLDAVAKRLKKMGEDFATIDEDRLQKLCSEQVELLIQSDNSISNFVKHSAHNAYIIDSAAEILGDCVRAYAQMSRAGDFRLKASELVFGKQTDIQFRLTTDTGKEINLNGIIDRIDCVEVNGKTAAIIFDYKKTAKSFSWSRLYHGLDMQLAIYMLAIAGAKIADCKIDFAVGGFYLPIEASPEGATIDELDKYAKKFNYKAGGLFNGQFVNALEKKEKSGWSNYYNYFISKENSPYGNFAKSSALTPEEFKGLLSFTESKITHLARRILAGEISIKPYRMRKISPCSYCDYRPVCRFDWQINDYNPLDSMSKTDVLQKTGGVNGV